MQAKVLGVSDLSRVLIIKFVASYDLDFLDIQSQYLYVLLDVSI